MADAPASMGTPHSAPGLQGFLKTDTAGMPNWVWLLVIAGGIGLALAVKHYGTKKNASDTTTTGTDQTSGLGLAVDPTTGLPYAVEGLVPAGGTVGSVGAPPPPTPPPSFAWPAALTNMKIWEGTGTHEFFYGPKGPQKGKKDQFSLASLFPAGTKFSSPSGKSGSIFYYTLPGTTTPIQAPVTLVNPMPGHGGPPTQAVELNPAWPGGTSQVRLYE